MEYINFIDMQVSEVAVVARPRRLDGIWTMPNHDAYVPTRKKLPPFHGGSFRGTGSPGEGAEFTLNFSQINLTAVTAEKTSR